MHISDNYYSPYKVYKRQNKTKDGSVKLFEVVDNIIKENINKGNIINNW